MTDFDLWAPRAENSVDLAIGDRTVAMTKGDHGWWHASPDATDGERYAYCLDGGDERPDPRSLSQPDGPDGRSAVVDLTSYEWGDGDWAGTALEGAVIYELHVGTFTHEGTFEAAVAHLDHLVELGVTLVELMPVVGFPGERGWGYDGVSPYAVHAAYGGARGLQKFVDACHAKGLGVCLDVVYNHLGPSGNYLPVFGPYFTDSHQTPWGWAINLDAAGSDTVRQYLIGNAVMWLRDFHVDALRLDAVHALIDDRAMHVLEEMAATVDLLSLELGRPLNLIAESDRNDPSTVGQRAIDGNGGLGLHGQWADDVHHTLHVLLTGETQGYYLDFAAPQALSKTLTQTPFFHDGTYSTFRGRHHGRPVDPATPGWRFVTSLQTHDQVGNRARGDRMSQLVSPGRAAIGAALLLTSPYTPMLFMGEEWGASTPWQYFTDHQDPDLAAAVSKGRKAEFAEHGWGDDVPDPQESTTFVNSELNWDELSDEPHRSLLAFYRDLIALRKAEPDLHNGTLGAGLVEREGDIITVTRGEHVIVANLGETSHPLPPGKFVVAAFDASMGAGNTVTVEPDGVVVLGPGVHTR